MRGLFLFISLCFFISLYGQNKLLIPASGVYSSTVIVKSNPTQTIYYTSGGYAAPETLKTLRDSLVITTTKSLLFRIKEGNWDTLIHRSYHFDYASKFAILSIAMDPQDLWNDTSGIYVKGKYAIFDDSSGHWINCNYQKNWEKKVYTTFIDTNNVVGFSQQSGLKVFGESTRRQADKSLKIIAREAHGKKRFKYPIFPDKDIKKYKQLVIRSSGNDYNKTRFKDAYSAYIVRNMGVDYMAWRPIKLFINGEYWGVYNLREKINDHYIASNHKVDKDSVNITMGRWITQQGSGKKYNEMYYWFAGLDTMDNKSYEKAKQYLDIRNYINYRVFQIYINNKDSRGNIRYYYVNGAKDERFKMIVYDTDLGYGKYSMNYLEKCISPIPTEWYNPAWSTLYLSKLMGHPEFKNEFANQFAHLMNTSLHKDTLLAAVDYFEALYTDELPRSSSERPNHLKKTYFPIEEWRDEVNSLRSYAKLRPKVMWNQLQEALGLDDTFVLTVKGDSGFVSINDNYPIPLPFSGKYFRNIPLKIQIMTDSSFYLKKWTDGDSNSLRTINCSQDSVTLIPIFEERTIKTKDNTLKVETDSASPNKVKTVSNDYLFWIASFFVGLGVLLFILYLFWKKTED